jgi:hypothetical protein
MVQANRSYVGAFSGDCGDADEKERRFTSTLRSRDVQRIRRFARHAWITYAVLVISALVISGCETTRYSARYNPYAQREHRPALVGRGDELMEAAGRALDNLDDRLENALY